MKRKNKKSPSRVRYEESHPTVSARVDKELYDRLTDVRELAGKSFADIFREAQEFQEVAAEGAFLMGEEHGFSLGREEGYDAGLAEGRKAARQQYVVSYKCCECGRLLEVVSREEKALAREAMEEHGWHHVNCPTNG
jgi:flagellar biosynthesis/type III secretory pathway protein FliH